MLRSSRALPPVECSCEGGPGAVSRHRCNSVRKRTVVDPEAATGQRVDRPCQFVHIMCCPNKIVHFCKCADNAGPGSGAGAAAAQGGAQGGGPKTEAGRRSATARRGPAGQEPPAARPPVAAGGSAGFAASQPQAPATRSSGTLLCW